MIDPGSTIHPLAMVDNASIAARSTVWQFASVIRDAKVGEDCTIGSCAVVDGAVVGNRCSMGHGAQVHPGASLGDDVFVGPGAILCNDRWPVTDKAGFRLDLLRRGFVTVRIGNGASIGAGAIVLPGVTIGDRAMIAAGATVHCDVPAGYLFKRDGSMCKIRNGFLDQRMREAKIPVSITC